ncbi:pyrroloquinoline quinone biosynthesis peptide chaperone PqqD [Rhizobium sp. TRM95111]|uniref:pyrroloquinoline quinone biosynthesis peptide chaperone PqqD n=1 Tax=Rhizobium alarense TaxID=2846851 RepID=UPI001F2546A5|nr:pyrroloquinoline quinone biosynthesis peptide chaperone PqqD [Rhizobium alarense]MCF3639639.1 pyrroloquinoline quinone biosynthesis peptide chaperone PqqD [Rhizobium alarense]
MSVSLVPLLPRGMRLHHDRVRDAMVLLVPERALLLDEIGAAILGEVDGRSTLAAIAARLAERYGAPQPDVAADVRTFLDGLVAQRLMDYQ